MDSSITVESQTTVDENIEGINDSDCSDEEMFSRSKPKQSRRVNNILDSDEEETSLDNNAYQMREPKSSEESDVSDTNSIENDLKITKNKRRIVKQLDSDSDQSTSSPKKSETKTIKFNKSPLVDKSDSSSESEKETPSYSQSSRIKEKRFKFENKFKSMLSKRNKLTKDAEEKNNECKSNEERNSGVKSSLHDLYDSDSGDDEVVSDKRSEGSAEEEDVSAKKTKPKGKQQRHPMPKDNPKVQRMSAKQAMEQMQKIKSESTRMLREKQVSLPYHKPKQMSLKDIMAKRRNTSVLGNSRYGFKMNSDQLKEYAKELERREKEMLELCKSESDEEKEPISTELNEEKKSEVSETMNTEGEGKSIQEESEDFTAIQKACKNLLDIFDRNEQPANTVAMNDTEPTNDCDVDTEKNIDNLDETDKLINDTKKANENTGDTLSINSNNDVNEDVVMDSDKHVSSEENTEGVDKDEIENCSKDDGTDHEKELENVDMESAQKNDKMLDSENKELPESELLFEDTDMDFDFKIDEIINKANNDYNSKNNEAQIDINSDARNNISRTQINDRERPLNASQQISCSAPVLSLQPKLTGTPGTFIDLISGEVQSGVELLKKKFMFHSAIKTAEELEREQERKILPGSALQKLKRDLEDKIIDNRTQEWTKRLEDLAKKKKEENDNLSDYEEILEKEESGKIEEKIADEMDEDESCEEEEEPEENDVDLTKEKMRKKCGLLDEEAEVDDEENIVSADEKEDCDEGNEEDGSDDDTDSSDDSGDDLTTDTGIKKPLTRIIKPLNDSDSSDDEGNGDTLTVVQEPKENNDTEELTTCGEVNLNITIENDILHSDLTTPIKENGLKRSSTSDIFDSQSASKNNSLSYDWDDIPLGQKIAGTTPTPTSVKRLSNISLTQDKANNSGVGRSDLASLVSPVIKLSGVPRMSSVENDHSEELTSPSKYSRFQYENEKINNLQKKLLFEAEATQCSQDLEDLGSLCSGKFPSQETTSHSSSRPSNLYKLLDNIGDGLSQENGFTQDTENELLGLCTGKFVGINDTQSQAMTTLPVDDSQNITLSLSETQNTEELNKAVENILSRKETEQNTDDVRGTNSNKSLPNSKDSRINSFFKSTKSDSMENPVSSQVNNDVKDVPEIAVSNRGGKFAIISSDDDVNILNESDEKDKTKILKTKKERNKKLKKKIHLQFSDDESEEDNDEEDEVSGEDKKGEEDDRVVDYDSEENEIEVQTEAININKGKKKKKASEFFDQEAELTSEDEWIGSGDEDERGMDKLEWEEGDADQLDQREVKKQLERIHLRTILDDDKREVRLLQEILLEDDLEGGTRERKFRWRNVDSTIEVGATVGDDDVDCGTEEIQTEEEWRKQRHERETFLRQMMEKENTQELSQFSQDSQSSTLKIVSRTSITSLLTRKSLSKDNVTSNGGVKSAENKETKDNDTEFLEKSKKVTKDLPSPVKKPFTLLKHNVRGSFLSRGQASLNRLAMLTKNAPQAQEEGEPTNLSSLAPGKKKNFVFATVSPPCIKNEISEEVKMAKRKATSEMSTPILIKKTRLIEETTPKTRKSLIDHID